MDQSREILQQGLQKLNISSTEDKLDSLLNFLSLIKKWNKTYNLTAVHNREEMTRLHLLDSLAILPYIQGQNIADVGTGAGLPGIPLAVYLPDVEFTLIDSNSKKTRFVQQAILELNLKNVTLIHNRVENIQANKQFSTIIMRAFANLHNIISLTKHLIDDQGILLAMKGQKPEQELSEISKPYSIIPIHVPGVLAERCLIRIEEIYEHG